VITRSSLIVALALIIAAALPGRAAEPNKSDLLEQMAREKFGALATSGIQAGLRANQTRPGMPTPERKVSPRFSSSKAVP